MLIWHSFARLEQKNLADNNPSLVSVLVAGVVGISAIWAGAREVALTDGAIEVLSIAQENLRENCPSTSKSAILTFSPQSSLQENTLFCAAWDGSKSLSSPQSFASVSAPSDLQMRGERPTAAAAAVGRLRWGNSADIVNWLRWQPLSRTHDAKAGSSSLLVLLFHILHIVYVSDYCHSNFFEVCALSYIWLRRC